MIWNPGDDSDVMDGDNGVDTVQDNDGNGDSTFVVKPKVGDPTRVDAIRINAPFTLNIDAEKLVVNGNGGNDNITGPVGVGGLTKIEMNGGDGNDVLVGTDGDDVQNGGAGTDTITGAHGNDDMAGDDDDDILIWNPGDGTDRTRAAPAPTSRRTTAAARRSTSSSRPTASASPPRATTARRSSSTSARSRRST